MGFASRIALLGLLAGTANSLADLPTGVIAVDNRIIADPCSGTTIGRDWCHPYADLQVALAFAANPSNGVTQVWVAAGTYSPGASRSDSFVIPDGISLYGSFTGATELGGRNEQTLAARDAFFFFDPVGTSVGAPITVLVGGGAGGAYHVVTLTNTGSTTLIDGVRISGGHADGSDDDAKGAGILMLNSDARVVGCYIVDNYSTTAGGGIEFTRTGAADVAQFVRCQIEGNFANLDPFAAAEGGGMEGIGGPYRMERCVFFKNSSVFACGGLHAETVFLDTCTFSNNSAFADGGLGAHAATLNWCIFEFNTASGDVGGMYADSAIATDTVFYGNNASENNGAAQVGGPSAPPSRFLRCSFDNNAATNGLNAGIVLAIDGTTIEDCIFRKNSAYNGSSAIFSTASCTISNCTVRDNHSGGGDYVSPNGAALEVDSTVGGVVVNVNNSIFWYNEGQDSMSSTVVNESTQAYPDDPAACYFSYSTVYDWHLPPPVGRLLGDSQCNGSDPSFYLSSPLSGVPGIRDYVDSGLVAPSPCIDTGDNSYVSADRTADIALNPRIAGANGAGGYIVDRGCLEVPRSGCYPNCDNSTTAPILNVLDFTCFLNAFSAGDPYANCDNSTTPPTINVLDFTCFLNAFSAGCS